MTFQQIYFCTLRVGRSEDTVTLQNFAPACKTNFSEAKKAPTAPEKHDIGIFLLTAPNFNTSIIIESSQVKHHFREHVEHNGDISPIANDLILRSSANKK
jgi:hypothetical protein